MKQAMRLSQFIIGLVLFCLPILLKAQDKQYKMPDPINGAPTINSFFQKVFEINSATNLLKARVDGMDKELTDKSALDIDPLKMINEYNDCSNLLKNLLPTISAFAGTFGDLPSKFKSELSSKPLRILSVMGNFKRACSAIWDSQKDLTSMFKSVLPNIKAKAKDKKGDELAGKLNNIDSVGTEAALAIPVPSIQEPEAGTTIFIIEKIGYADVQPVMDALKAHTKISGMKKTFSNDIATIEINHTATADELTDFFMSSALGNKFTVVEVSKEQIKLRSK